MQIILYYKGKWDGEEEKEAVYLLFHDFVYKGIWEVDDQMNRKKTNTHFFKVWINMIEKREDLIYVQNIIIIISDMMIW